MIEFLAGCFVGMAIGIVFMAALQIGGKNE